MALEMEDDFEDLLVTSWTPRAKKAFFYVSKSASFEMDINVNRRKDEITAVFAPLRPTGNYTVLFGHFHQDEPYAKQLMVLDPTNLTVVGEVLDLAKAKHPVAQFNCKLVSGYLSPQNTHDIILDSKGILSVGKQKLSVKIEYKKFNRQKVPDMVEHFKHDSDGLVFIDGKKNQIKELKGTQTLNYPILRGLRGFAVTKEYIFAVTSYQGCVLVRFTRGNTTKSEEKQLQAFKPDQFECMQAYKDKVFICFLKDKSQKSFVSSFNDHHILMYSAELSFMRSITFSSYAFFPPKLHTPGIVDVLRNSVPKENMNQHWAFKSSRPTSSKMTREEERHLKLRNIQKAWRKDINLCEMVVFPYDGDDSFLVLALRDERNCFYLFAVQHSKIYQCDSIQKQDVDYYPGEAQFRIYPTHDQKGIISFSSAGAIEKMYLHKYLTWC